VRPKLLFIVYFSACILDRPCDAQNAAVTPTAVCPDPPGATEVCIDTKRPVTPLNKAMFPGEALHIEVIGKTPWQKVTVDQKVSEVEDESKKLAETLFRFLAKVGLALPPFTMMNLQPPPQQAIPEPYQSAFQILNQELGKVDDELLPVMSAMDRDGRELKEFLSKPAGDLNAFETTLDELIKKSRTNAEEIKQDLSKETALLDVVRSMIRNENFYRLQSDVQQRILNEYYLPAVERHQSHVTLLAEVREGVKSFAAASKMLGLVKGDKANWLVHKEDIRAAKNQKVDIEVSYVDVRKADAKAVKLAAFNATWRSQSRITASLGLAVSFLAKEDFSLKTIRGSGPITDASLTYQITSSTARPVLFPVSLIHFRPYGPSRRSAGFTLTGGAGVDVSGSSPTGELVAGASLRLGSVYISPLVHFGRRKSLAEGYTRGESAPKGFTVPTVDKWGKQFAIAITYRFL